MLTMFGVDALQGFSFALPVLIEESVVGDVEQVVQLFNLMLSELGTSSLSISQAFLFALLDKLESLAEPIPGEMTAPHTEVERKGIRKLYISIVHHIFSTGSKITLFCDQNRHRAADVYCKLASYTKDIPFSTETKIVLLRSAIGVFQEICKTWTDSEMPFAQQLNTAVVLNDVIPFLINAPVDGSLSVKDAQTQAVIAELGSLLWILKEKMGDDAFVAYLAPVLQRTAWTSSGAEALISQLRSNLPMTTYREEFKKLVRSTV